MIKSANHVPRHVAILNYESSFTRRRAANCRKTWRRSGDGFFPQGGKGVKPGLMFLRQVARKLRRIRGLYGQTVQNSVKVSSAMVMSDAGRAKSLALPLSVILYGNFRRTILVLLPNL